MYLNQKSFKNRASKTSGAAPLGRLDWGLTVDTSGQLGIHGHLGQAGEVKYPKFHTGL